MKGRNTRCITVRLPEVVVYALEEKAKVKGYATVGGYIKSQLLKSMGYSDIATNEDTVTSGIAPISSAITINQESPMSRVKEKPSISSEIAIKDSGIC